MEIAVGSRPGAPQRGGDEAYVAEIVAPGVVLLAVAHGFGRIRERPAPAVAAQAVRDSLRRRVRGERRDPRAALAVFQTLRVANLALLKSLKPEQWKHFGMHAERGEESIERITEMIAGHDINHLIQIEAILGGGRK